jgi:hypothetical protein
MFKIILSFCILLFVVETYAQDSSILKVKRVTSDTIVNDTSKRTILIQVKQGSKLKTKALSNDSTDVMVEISNGDSSFPTMVIHRARVLGNKSLLSIELPDSVVRKSKSIKITDLPKVACTRCPASEYQGEVLLSAEMKLFDFKFSTAPDGADLYLIPLRECQNYFQTTIYNNINITPASLGKIANTKISIKSTPVVYSVIEETYVAVFVLNPDNMSKIKIKKAIIRPNRSIANQNQVNINF